MVDSVCSPAQVISRDTFVDLVTPMDDVDGGGGGGTSSTSRFLGLIPIPRVASCSV